MASESLADMFSQDAESTQALPSDAIDPALVAESHFQPEDNEDADDLFGDNEEQPLELPTFALEPEISPAEAALRQNLEYNEDPNAVPAAIPSNETERVATLHLVTIPAPRSSLKQFWQLKLPAFLAIDPKPFDPNTWEPTTDKDGPLSHLPDENIIRWRWVKDQDQVWQRQANARLIKWSDGEMSVQIGSEIFDVVAHPDHAGQDGQGLSYLVADHLYCGLLETQVRLTGTMTLIPTTIHSKAHRKLASAVKKTHQKTIKTQLTVQEQDPEFQAAQRLKQEKEREREARKAQRDAGRTSGHRSRGSLRSRRLDIYSDDDEDEDLAAAVRPERDEPIGDFIEDDDDDDEADDAATMEVDDADPDDLDKMDQAAEAASRRARKQAKPAAGSPSQPMDVDQPEPATVQKRRLVIADSDDEA